MEVNVVIEIVLAIFTVITLVSTVIISCKCAEAKVNKDEIDAAKYGIIERACSKLFWVSFIALVAVVHQDLMTTGFVRIITILEGMLNG